MPMASVFSRCRRIPQYVQGGFSRHQVSVLPGEPRRETCPNILRSDHRDGPLIGDVLAVILEEHHTITTRSVLMRLRLGTRRLLPQALKSRSTGRVSALVTLVFLYRRKVTKIKIVNHPALPRLRL